MTFFKNLIYLLFCYTIFDPSFLVVDVSIQLKLTEGILLLLLKVPSCMRHALKNASVWRFGPKEGDWLVG